MVMVSIILSATGNRDTARYLVVYWHPLREVGRVPGMCH